MEGVLSFNAPNLITVWLIVLAGIFMFMLFSKWHQGREQSA